MCPLENAVIAAFVHGFSGENVFVAPEVWESLRKKYPKRDARKVVFSIPGKFIPENEFDYPRVEQPREAVRMFVIIRTIAEWRGADCISRVYGPYNTEDEALEVLAEVRDDDPEYGNGWTYMEVENA